MMNNNDGPQGLGGWLILPMLGLILTPIRLGALLVMTYLPIFSEGAWEVLTTPGSEAYHPLWAPFLIFEILGNACFVVFAGILLILLFKKHYRFPSLMILFYVSNLAFVGIDFFVADLIPAVAEESDPESIKELTRTVISAAIWIPYFMRSRRVQNTFTYGKVEQGGDGNSYPPPIPGSE